MEGVGGRQQDTEKPPLLRRKVAAEGHGEREDRIDGNRERNQEEDDVEEVMSGGCLLSRRDDDDGGSEAAGRRPVAISPPYEEVDEWITHRSEFEFELLIYCGSLIYLGKFSQKSPENFPKLPSKFLKMIK